MTTPNSERIKRILAEENPEAILLDHFDDALCGYARRCGQPTLAVYDYEKCIQILVDVEGMHPDDAEEHFEFNVVGGWYGPNTPVILYAEGQMGLQDEESDGPLAEVPSPSMSQALMSCLMADMD